MPTYSVTIAYEATDDDDAAAIAATIADVVEPVVEEADIGAAVATPPEPDVATAEPQVAGDTGEPLAQAPDDPADDPARSLPTGNEF